jgi:hypothetical protein
VVPSPWLIALAWAGLAAGFASAAWIGDDIFGGERGLSFGKGVVAAAKADVLSLSAFEVGLFGWTALMAFVFFPSPHHLRPDTSVYWFLMQIGMIIGFFTAWPVNTWLIRKGIKEAM